MTTLAEILRCARETFDHLAQHPRTLDDAATTLKFIDWDAAIRAAEKVEGNFFED